MIYHIVQPRAGSDPRLEKARASWEKLYATGRVKQHIIPARPNATEIGDTRDLPYLRAALSWRKPEKDTILMLTNDDVLLEVELIDELERKLKEQVAVSSHRVNLPDGQTDYGRDLFAFRQAYLIDHSTLLPDMFLGELEWDICLARLVRSEAGCRLDGLGRVTKAELTPGLVLHERHIGTWQLPEMADAPAKVWNRMQARRWYARRGWESLCTV